MGSSLILHILPAATVAKPPPSSAGNGRAIGEMMDPPYRALIEGAVNQALRLMKAAVR